MAGLTFKLFLIKPLIIKTFRRNASIFTEKQTLFTRCTFSFWGSKTKITSFVASYTFVGIVLKEVVFSAG